MEDGVINSAEVEQEAEQENECALAVCANAIVAQTQVGTALVTNTATIQDDATNSAEVEQEAEQENECALAVCANVIGLQTQVGGATVDNLGGIL